MQGQGGAGTIKGGWQQGQLISPVDWVQLVAVIFPVKIVAPVVALVTVNVPIFWNTRVVPTLQNGKVPRENDTVEGRTIRTVVEPSSVPLS